MEIPANTADLDPAQRSVVCDHLFKAGEQSLAVTNRYIEDLVDQVTTAIENGDLNAIHSAYSVWFSEQRPDATTGILDKAVFEFAAIDAVSNVQPAILAYILSQGVKLNHRIIEPAVRGKSTRVLQVLLDSGWNINEPQTYSDPPFLSLVIRDEALVLWFLDHGADPNATAGLWDVTPLSIIAVQFAPLSTVQLLFDRGGSAENGQLVNYACGRIDSDCVPVLQFLIDHGAPINNTLWENRPELEDLARAVQAETPIHSAALVGNLEAVKFLLEHGADQSKPSISGKLPIDAAIWRGHTEMEQLLRAHQPNQSCVMASRHPQRVDETQKLKAVETLS